MTELYFYHLQQPLEAVLPSLLEKSLERGWRVIVQAGSQERVDALDAHLWTYRDNSFLPHGAMTDGAAAEQPIWLTTTDDNPNAASVRVLIDRAPLPAQADSYTRLMLIFDGNDPDALDAARGQWREATGRGMEVAYWQQGDGGRWERKT
jgi:DNA polymerase-3 subunit chi